MCVCLGEVEEFQSWETSASAKAGDTWTLRTFHSLSLSRSCTRTHTYSGMWIVDHYHRCHLLQSSATIKGHPGGGNKRSPWALHREPNDQSHKLEIKVSIGRGRGCREKRATLDVLGCDGYQLDKFSWRMSPVWQLKSWETNYYLMCAQFVNAGTF